MEKKILPVQQHKPYEENEAICFSDTEEIREAIKNDRPIPVSKEQFELINALTRLMLGGKI